MTQTHTPGPWLVSEGEPDHGIISIGEQSKLVAMVTEDEDYEMADGERDANARLIAAAPDLLEACLAVEDCDWPSSGPLHTLALQKVYAAIAKARGEAVKP